MAKALLLVVSHVAADDSLSLLQTRAAVHSNSTLDLATNPVNWGNHYIAGPCGTTRFAPQDALNTVLLGTSHDVSFCHCWGDTHCSHLPFDPIHWEAGRHVMVNHHHHQYMDQCASTFAKSAPGNPGGSGSRWEVQIQNSGPDCCAGVWGAAVKVGGFTFEAWNRYAREFYVNGEKRAAGQPVNLPNGLHYWHHGAEMCVMQEGQFLFRLYTAGHGAGASVALMVPKTVQVQGPGTVCNDVSNLDSPLAVPGLPTHGRRIKNAQVAIQPGLMAHQEAYLNSPSAARYVHIGHVRSVCKALRDGQNKTEEPFPAWNTTSSCEESGFPLSQAEQNCDVLRENHPDFYEDCVIDECVNGNAPVVEDEVEVIEGIIEGEEATDMASLSEVGACNDVPTFTINDPTYSNLAGQGPDTGPLGILYPDAAVINGESVDVLLTAAEFTPFRANLNGAAGGLLSLNMKCGTSATLTITIVGKDKTPVVVPAAAITVLDLDEGKKTKGRTTVSSCGAVSATAGPELTIADVAGEPGCKVYSSSKRGTAANNPQSVDAITEDQKKRAVSFLYGEGSSFTFEVAMSKDKKGRNLLFSLAPVLACE